MPVLNRRPRVIAPRPSGSARNSTESNEGVKEHLWVVEEDYEKPQKEMDFPSAKLGKMPSMLRINPYAKHDLHDRYLSSEEEISPSPDDGGHNYEEEMKQSSTETAIDDSLDTAGEEFKAEIAVAVPILAFGRPKLIDITNLAPMHKRKRPAKPLLPHPVPQIHNHYGAIRASVPAAVAPAPSTVAPAAPATTPPIVVDENYSPPAYPVPEPMVLPPHTRQPLKRKEGSIAAPDSWLPNDRLAENDDERDYFPAVKARSTPGHRHEYEPFAFGLDSPRRVANRSVHRFSTRVLEVNDYGASGSSQLTPTSPSGTPAGWKGLTRSLSLVKRHSGTQQVSKKPKMIPRGANEREDSPIIPPFPFENEVAVAS